ncbi:response regulator [Brevibacillus dissolubilis]|uniref:response regulator n=1 Tax=Brevibacillus dissolubilis TaxID=1844116 RepID=UPI001117571C|nr:response regulator [Brevibacillus dissolubilis]
MYKIVIVDDDRIIRRGISNSIPWNTHGFEIVGEASDGEHGLRVIEEHKPHIVISDIKMPFMDGLQMAGAVKETSPDTKVILLTGYEDFHYAKEAIKIKAFDYLLKPVDKAILLEKVKQASAEWTNERKVEQNLRAGLPYLRHRFLTDLIHNQVKAEDFEREKEFLGLTLDHSHYAVLIVKVDDYYQMSSTDKDRDKEQDNEQGQDLDKDVLKYCILNICQETIQRDGRGVTFDNQGDEILIIYSDQENIAQHMQETIEEIRANVRQFLQTTVSIARGGIYQDHTGIAASYQEACSAIEYRHIMGKDKVYTTEDTTALPSKESPTQAETKVNEIENDLIQKVKLGLTQDVITLLDNFRATLIQQEYISLYQVQVLAIQMIFLLFREVEQNHRDELHTHYDEIHRLQTIDEIVEKVKQVSVDIAYFVNAQRESQKNGIVETAVRYIETHYAKDGLSLQEVAKAVHITPTYLSILFKQEQKINFSDYLLEIRMKKAMELLRTQPLKTYEVAEQVGYSNPQYFSVCFKKYTGISPADFKKQ